MSRGKLRYLLGFLSAAAVALSTAVAQPAVGSATSNNGALFAITRSQELVKVDPGSGSLTQLGGLFPNCSGNCPLDSQSFELASDPTTHRLFAVRMESFSFNWPPVFTQELLTIDSQTGTVLSNPQFTVNAPQALAFDTSSHTLFGFTGSAIVKVDPATAAVTPFAPVGPGPGFGVNQMALSSASHTIFVSEESLFLPASPTPTQVFAVDTNTGQVAPPVTVDTPVRWIVTDGASLFGITDTGAPNLVAINTTTGATTLVAGIASGSLFIPTGPTSDPTTHTVYVDVSIFNGIGFQDNIYSINDQTGASSSSPINSLDNLTSMVFEAPPQVTPQSIEDDVKAAFASGAIDNAGIERSLLAKLDEAAAARASASASGSRTNGCATAANVYQAFIDEVNAQSLATASSARGHIVAATASQLVSEAQFLIANCP